MPSDRDGGNLGAVKPVATRARFFDAPLGRFLRGRSWIFACPCKGVFATFLGGRPNEADLRDLTRVYAVPAARDAHVVLFDGSRVEAVDAAAHAMLLEHFRARAEVLTRALTRVAVVHGPGVIGALFAGYPKILALRCETRTFVDTDAALVWLGADERVRADSIAIADSLGARDGDLQKLSAFLDENPGASLVEASRLLGVASRTLQRKLRDEGTTFRGEVDRARRDRALGRMLDSDDPLTTIAMELGFSSLQSFTDWFRAQVGEAPSAWRNKARSQRR